MNCKKCGTENNQDSVFCKSCGARIDGKKACPRCKKLIDDDNVFCTYCGARVDGKLSCPKCNELVSENTAFCTKCGAALKTRKISYEKESKPIVTTGIRSIFKNIGFYLGLASVVLCLIFTFCIGVVPYTSAGGTTVTADGIYFYYFLKEAYSNIPDNSYAGFYLVGPIIGSLCVIGFLVSSIVSVVYSLVYFTRSFTNDKYFKKFIKSVVVTYFTYICFVVVFNSLMTLKGGYTTSISMGYKLNGATIAGVVLSTISMFVTIVFYVLCRTEKVNRYYITNGILTLVVLAVGSAGLGLLSASIVTISESSVSASYGVYYLAYYLYTRATSYTINTTATPEEFLRYYIPTIVFIVLIVVLTIIFMIWFVNMMKSLLVDLDEERKNKIYSQGAVAGAVLIGVGVLQIVLRYYGLGYLMSASGFSLVVPIFMIIVGILLIVVSSISNILLNANNNDVEYNDTYKY